MFALLPACWKGHVLTTSRSHAITRRRSVEVKEQAEDRTCQIQASEAVTAASHGRVGDDQ